jgi:hypothetical protein
VERRFVVPSPEAAAAREQLDALAAEMAGAFRTTDAWQRRHHLREVLRATRGELETVRAAVAEGEARLAELLGDGRFDDDAERQLLATRERVALLAERERRAGEMLAAAESRAKGEWHAECLAASHAHFAQARAALAESAEGLGEQLDALFSDYLQRFALLALLSGTPSALARPVPE